MVEKNTENWKFVGGGGGTNYIGLRTGIVKVIHKTIRSRMYALQGS